MHKSISKFSWFKEQKSYITNITAVLFIIIGYKMPLDYKTAEILKNMGYFAFSGAITNWLAVHMLFEKVPFLYGSGVIPVRFNEFKSGIKDIIMSQFFTKENISRFTTKLTPSVEMSDLSKTIDFDKIYQGLVDTIMNSSFGGMLSMVGGEAALAPLKEPVISKLKVTVAEIGSTIMNQESNTGNEQFSSYLSEKIEYIVDERMSELTPKMVKEIMQNIIQKHLGWLVVWGGVFGALIGAVLTITGN